MKRDLFRRYVWLVDVVRHAHKITYEEIANLWLASPQNEDHSPLALRTFHNHRDAIEHLFDIRILCDRSDHNTYYIASDRQPDATKLKVWMLQTLSMSHVARRNETLENRIVLDITPEEKFGLITIIEAMKNGSVLAVDSEVPLDEGRRRFEIGPYCIRFFNNTWWMLGRDMETNHLRPFDLARVQSVRLTGKKFAYPKDFNPTEYFSRFYGMGTGSDLQPYKITLRVSGRSRDYVKAIPLQSTQKEVSSTAESSVFEYMLVPSQEFLNAILEMGPEAEVLGPNSFRSEVMRTIQQMASLYRVESEN